MNRFKTTRSGWTLVELLVVIGIVGILLAITLPAVMMARSVVSRVGCGNNLRQIALAAQLYESSHRVYPGDDSDTTTFRVWPESTSLLEKTLPWIEEAEFDLTHVPSVFRCPADAFGGEDDQRASYLVCYGTNANHRGPRESPSSDNDPSWGHPGFGQAGPHGWRAADFQRGLSNTAILSEQRARPWGMLRKDVRAEDSLWYFDQTTASDPQAACLDGTLRTRETISSNWGIWWGLIPSGRLTDYDHGLPPFAQPCLWGSVSGIHFAPSSQHDGIVTVAYADGHLQTFGHSVDLVTWRNMSLMRTAGEIN